MELVNLKVYDLDVERGTVMVRQGKGKKDRMIPIGARAIAWIEKYLREARPELVVAPDEGTLFLTTTARPSARHAHAAGARVRERRRDRQDAAPAISSGTRWRP